MLKLFCKLLVHCCCRAFWSMQPLPKITAETWASAVLALLWLLSLSHFNLFPLEDSYFCSLPPWYCIYRLLSTLSILQYNAVEITSVAYISWLGLDRFNIQHWLILFSSFFEYLNTSDIVLVTVNESSPSRSLHLGF